MTRQEAIDVLTADYPDAWYEEDLREAFDMAIASLRGDVPDTNDGDMISRQAAIDAMSAVNDSICEQQAIDALCELPSAESSQPNVIHCKDCKYYLEGSDGLKYCFNHDDDILWFDDDFCSKAKRRNDE